MPSHKLFTLTSCYKPGRDSTQILDDSKPVHTCKHKHVGQAITGSACLNCAGPRNVLLVCERLREEQHFGNKVCRTNTYRGTAVVENSREGRDNEHEHTASPTEKLEDNVTLTHGLEVQCHHLTANVPEHLGHVIRGVHSGAFGVNPAHLAFVVSTIALLEPKLEHSLCTLTLAHEFRFKSHLL